MLADIGFGLATVAGPLRTSRLYAEPNYEVILSWDPQAVPDDWRVVRSPACARTGSARR